MPIELSHTLHSSAAASVAPLGNEGERRRPGRLIEVSEHLIPILRNPDAFKCTNVPRPNVVARYRTVSELRPFRGTIVIGALSAVLWFMLIEVIRMTAG